MNRSIGISTSVALAVHLLALLGFATATGPERGRDWQQALSASEPAKELPPSPRELVDTAMAVEFVRIAPASRPAKPAMSAPKPGSEPAMARLRTDTAPTASRMASKAPHPSDDTADPAGTPDPPHPSSSPLRMRHEPIPDLDPRAGSQLAAAIASASGPSSDERGDLLGTPVHVAKKRDWAPSGNGTLEAEGQPFEATVARDGRIVFRDKPNFNAHFGRVKLGEQRTLPLPIIGGGFDITDAVMASFGDVLYPYRKMQLMDQSRERRAAMALQYRDEVLEQALARYGRRLAKLWKNPEYALDARKQILFALWDECAERGPDKVVSTARSIRAMTVQFIRRNLPPDHAGAYTKADLALLNEGRQSEERFAPY